VSERAIVLPEVVAARRVLVCLSFGAELETWGLVGKLLASGREVYVPRADPRDRRLHVHRYPCPLEALPFGLRQPPRGTPELEEAAVDATLDAALIVGLGFDRRGYRLGYGKGYFDRFLAGKRFPTIGLGYDHQMLDRLPVAPHDVRLSAVVTPSGIWRPDERAA
jgi:5-formyltetrahydrofolate cyclo-ligase